MTGSGRSLLGGVPSLEHSLRNDLGEVVNQLLLLFGFIVTHRG
jgi:hypothetical protein